LSYEELPATQAISKLSKSDYSPYHDHNLPPPPPPPQQSPYYYPHYYYPPPHRSSFEESQKVEPDRADKKIVQFDLPDEENNDNAVSQDNKRGTRGKRGRKSKGGPVRKSPRKKGGILNIAVDKVTESDNQQKSDSFMDTESDYQTHEEEETNDDGSN